MYLKDQRKVIWVKNLQIFEDYKNKLFTELPDYSEGTAIFQGFLLADADNEQLKADLDLTRVSQKAINVEANQPPLSYNKGRKVIEAEPILSEVIPPTSRGRKVVDAESCKSAINTSRGQKVVDAESHITDAINIRKGQKVVDNESRIQIAMKKSYTG